MLEDALERYPLMQVLDDGTACTLRPLEMQDESEFVTFLTAVPEIERLFIKQRVGSQPFRKRWCRDLDFERELPLIAIAHDRIIGVVILRQRAGGWKRHIGRVHSVVHPEYHDVGVSLMLIGEAIEAAQHSGLERLETEFNGERTASMHCYLTAGFREMLRMKGYLKNMAGGSHDWVLMGINLVPSVDCMGAGD